MHKTFDELRTALQNKFSEAENIKDMLELMAARKKNATRPIYASNELDGKTSEVS